MLKWRRGYWVGEGIRGHVRVQSKINAGKAVPGIWLITLPNNPANLLEVVPALMLVQREAYDQCPEIVGMARSEDQAFERIRDVVDEIYRTTGTVDLRTYMNAGE